MDARATCTEATLPEATSAADALASMQASSLDRRHATADAAFALASMHASSPATTSRSLSLAPSAVCKLQYPPISRADSFATWTAGLFPPSFDARSWFNTPSEAFYPGAPQPPPLSFDLMPSDGESDMADVDPAPRRRRRYRSHIVHTEQQRRRKRRKRSSQVVSDSPSEDEVSDDPTTPSPGRADDRSYSMPYRLIGDATRAPQTRIRPSPRRRDDAVLPEPGAVVEGGSPSVSPTWRQKRRLPATQPVLIDSLDEIGTDSSGKPSVLWWQLVRAIIVSSKEKKLSLDQICDLAQGRFPYFRTCVIGWRGTIRSVLMTKPCFTRTTIPDPNDARREIILFAIDDTIDPRRQRERANMGVGRGNAPRARGRRAGSGVSEEGSLSLEDGSD